MENKVKSLRLTDKQMIFIKNHAGKFTLLELSEYLGVYKSSIDKHCKTRGIHLLSESNSNNNDGEVFFNLNEYLGDALYI